MTAIKKNAWYFDTSSHRMVTFQGIRKSYFAGDLYTVRLRDICDCLVERNYRTLEEAQTDIEKNLVPRK